MAAVNGRHAALRQAQAALAGACEALLTRSPDAVEAFTSLLPLDQCDGEPEEWQQMATMLAARHQLAVEFSTTKTHIRVRFSRHQGATGA